MGASERLTHIISTVYDKVVGESLSMISEHLKYIHAGKAYYATFSFTIAAASTVVVLGRVPAGAKVHMKERFAIAEAPASQTCDVSITLFEDVTVTVEGSTVSTFNAERNGTAVSDFKIYSGSTSSGGNDIGRPTTLKSDKNVMASAVIGDEYVMEADSDYRLEYVNNHATQQVVVTTKWTWYEE